jgi:hypothetical protein
MPIPSPFCMEISTIVFGCRFVANALQLSREKLLKEDVMEIGKVVGWSVGGEIKF